MIFVYMLRCADGRYYVASTRKSLEARVVEHNADHFGGLTAARRPVQLVWHQEFQRAQDAIEAERQIKGWTRAKKEALIRGDYQRLHALSGSAARRAVSFDTPTGAKRRSAAQDEG